jgi:predicted dehydrogenase
LRWFPDRARVVGAADSGLTGQYYIPEPIDLVGWPDAIPQDRRFRDYRELLALPDVDAAIIATPEASHFEIACAALDAGKAVLLEKAAVVSFEQAAALYRRLQARPARFQLALNMRHREVVPVVRRLLRDRAIGRVVSVTAHMNAGHRWGAQAFRRFHGDAALDGDLTLSKVTHDSDVLHHVLGTHADTVTGVATQNTFVPRPGAGQVCRQCAITAECHEYIDVFATPASRVEHEAREARGLIPADICPYTAPTTSHDGIVTVTLPAASAIV